MFTIWTKPIKLAEQPFEFVKEINLPLGFNECDLFVSSCFLLICWENYFQGVAYVSHNAEDNQIVMLLVEGMAKLILDVGQTGVYHIS